MVIGSFFLTLSCCGLCSEGRLDFRGKEIWDLILLCNFFLVVGGVGGLNGKK